MNYSKRGIRAKQKSLHATSTKIGKKFLVSVLNLSLLGIISLGIIGISMGFGVFKGIIDTSPSIENIKVTPTGFSTFVYDLEGNQTAKLISQNSNRIPVTQDMIPEDLATKACARSSGIMSWVTGIRLEFWEISLAV